MTKVWHQQTRDGAKMISPAPVQECFAFPECILPQPWITWLKPFFCLQSIAICWGSHPEVHCYSGYRRSVKQSHDPRAVYYTRRLAINLPCRHCVNTAVIMHCRPGLLCLLKTGWSCTVQFHLLCCGTDLIDVIYVFIPHPCVRYVGKHVWLF